MFKYLTIVVLLLFFSILPVMPVSSSINQAQTLYPGSFTLQVSPANHSDHSSYQLWCFKEIPLELVFSGLALSASVQIEGGRIEEIDRSHDQYSLLVYSSQDGYIRLELKDKKAGQCKLNWKYQNPHAAFLAFARMYAQYFHPWQRRFYLDYYISPIKGNQQKYPPEFFRHSYPVTLGAPYSWGGKQALQQIHSKLLHNGIKAYWMEYYQQKEKNHPVNLDADESCFDPRPGPENPSYWTGIDCSGLLEISSYWAGLRYDWREADLISTGDYRSASHFMKIQAGDIFILRRDGIVVHFGIISRKGPTIATTWIIHSAWFTSFRYNTNALLKVAETSMGEFRSFYTWEIRRYHERS